MYFKFAGKKLPRKVFANTPKPAKKIYTKYCFFLLKKNNVRWARLGVSIAKSKIPQAAHRNQIKRVIRESFRLVNLEQPLDIVVVVDKTIGILTKAQIRAFFDEQWQQIKGMTLE